MSSRKRSPKSKALNPLTERAAEVNPEVSESSASPQSEIPEQSGGLLQNLTNLFRSSPEQSPQASPEAAADSSRVSSPEPETISKPLTPEIESALSAVPDVVGGPEVITVEGGEDGEGDAIAAVALSNRQKIDALIALGYVDEGDAGEMFDALFDYIADKAESEHWKLKEKQRSKLARPGAACINACLQKLFDALPETVGASAQEHPEVTALSLAVGAVVGPKLLKQLKVRKDRRNGVLNVAAVEAPATAAAPAENKKRPAVERGPLGIPVYSGKLQ